MYLGTDIFDSAPSENTFVLTNCLLTASNYPHLNSVLKIPAFRYYYRTIK